MTSFRYDIGKFNSQNENLNMSVSKYKSLCEQLFIKAKSIKNVWNDRTSEEFYNIAQADELKVNDIFESIEENKKNFEYFGTELSNIFSSRGYSTHDLIVEYDSSKVNLAYNCLDVVKRHIKAAEKAFNDCVVPSDYANLPALNEVFNALFNDIEYFANEMDWKLNDTYQKIETLVATNRTKSTNSPFVAMNDKLYYISPNPVSTATPNIEIKRNKVDANTANYTGTIDTIKDPNELNTIAGNTSIDIQKIEEIDNSNVVGNEVNGIISNASERINYMETKDDSNTTTGVINTGASEIKVMDDKEEVNTVAGLTGDYSSSIEVEENTIEANEINFKDKDVVEKIDTEGLFEKHDTETVTFKDKDVVKKIDGSDLFKEQDKSTITSNDKNVVGTLSSVDLNTKSATIDTKQVNAAGTISSANLNMNTNTINYEGIGAASEITPLVDTNISNNVNKMNFDFDNVSTNIDSVKQTEFKTRDVNFEDIFNNQQ
jgi:hypothetical protein